MPGGFTNTPFNGIDPFTIGAYPPPTGDKKPAQFVIKRPNIDLTVWFQIVTIRKSDRRRVTESQPHRLDCQHTTGV